MINLTIDGWLPKDPEVKTTSTGKTIVNFSLPYQQGKKEDNKPTIWFNLKAIGKAATFLENAKKGDKIKVTSCIPEQWTDKNGVNRLSWTVFAVEAAEDKLKAAALVDDEDVPF